MVFHEQAEALGRQMEAAYQQCDKLIKPFEDIVKASRDILTGVHQKEMKSWVTGASPWPTVEDPPGRKPGMGAAKI
jgi:hypothetical protein